MQTANRTLTIFAAFTRSDAILVPNSEGRDCNESTSPGLVIER